jgi:hypothetical protein
MADRGQQRTGFDFVPSGDDLLKAGLALGVIYLALTVGLPALKKAK